MGFDGATVMILVLLLLAVVLVLVFLRYVPLGLWVRALSSGVKVKVSALIGMRLRRISPHRLVDTLIMVRKAGLELGIPERLVFRQPFPGPGLGIRIIGEVTAEKVRIVQDADAIYREEVDKAVEAYKQENGKTPSWMPNQYFAALTNMRSVGVMGDERTYDYAVALRAVTTVDFMTAEAAEIPFEVLQTVMSRIINEVKGVNRVFYDLTSKPPGTIEFE